MSTVNDVTNVSSLFQNQGSKETALGKDDFLKLLIAQLPTPLNLPPSLRSSANLNS
jgi:flagellar hook assembly protein FlgD